MKQLFVLAMLALPACGGSESDEGLECGRHDGELMRCAPGAEEVQVCDLERGRWETVQRCTQCGMGHPFCYGWAPTMACCGPTHPGFPTPNHLGAEERMR